MEKRVSNSPSYVHICYQRFIKALYEYGYWIFHIMINSLTANMCTSVASGMYTMKKETIILILLFIATIT